MKNRSLLVSALCLAVTACSSAPPPKSEPPQEQPSPGQTVTFLEQSENAELKAAVGGTILKLSTTQDAVGENRPTVTQEVQYLGLTPGGRIKLRILSSDPAGDAKEVEQDPAAAFTLGHLKAEFLEAQPTWVRYRLSPADR